MTPDVNVMVAASRSDHPHHGAARGWLEQAVRSGAMLTLQPMVIASFLRLVTLPRVFVQPTPMPDAWLAAAVIHQGEHLVSFDADFKHLLSRSQFTRLPVA